MENKKINIIYYNMVISLFVKNEDEEIKIKYMLNNINEMYMKDIFRWCKIHNVNYKAVFHFRKDYPLSANTWNFYTYIRTLITKY